MAQFHLQYYTAFQYYFFSGLEDTGDIKAKHNYEQNVGRLYRNPPSKVIN